MIAEKKKMREAAAAVRAEAHRRKARTANRAVSGRVGDLLRDLAPDLKGVAVSAFWPMGDELNIQTTLKALHALGAVCALPCVVKRGEPLVFRRWRPGDVLVPAGFGTHEPAPDAEMVSPDIVLTAFLACDREGWRLGYGGGYYDRTLRALRGEKPIVAVGVGYDEQVVDAVPHGPGDERLDWLVTDVRTLRFD